ncbi:MAG: hypothetical protein K8I30_24735 [Anaerolineae bacterium]|nr:hypothetical protein [Anaerolineae bacterium]
MATRESNERRFLLWDDLPDGGRRYYAIKIGKVKNYARYVKIVDANEITISIVQEIYDNDDRLVAIHQKYPVDTGHQVIEGDAE